MTVEDHRKMLDYVRQEPMKDALYQHVTYANAVALLCWLVATAALGDIRLVLWLQLLVMSISLYFAGWIGFRLWLLTRSESLDRPFGRRAYAERFLIVLVIGGIFGGIAWFFFERPVIRSVVVAPLAAGITAAVVHVPLWWGEFNRLRKICLTHL